MSKPFKIFVIIIALFLYYATIPTLLVVYISENSALGQSVLAKIIGRLVLLLPFLIIGTNLLFKKHRSCK